MTIGKRKENGIITGKCCGHCKNFKYKKCLNGHCKFPYHKKAECLVTDYCHYGFEQK